MARRGLHFPGSFGPLGPVSSQQYFASPFSALENYQAIAAAPVMRALDSTQRYLDARQAAAPGLMAMREAGRQRQDAIFADLAQHNAAVADNPAARLALLREIHGFNDPDDSPRAQQSQAKQPFDVDAYQAQLWGEADPSAAMPPNDYAFGELQEQLFEQSPDEDVVDITSQLASPASKHSQQAMDDAARQYHRKQVAAYINANKVLSDPHTPQQQKEDAKRQFMMRYPNMPKPQPMTEEQLREIKQRSLLAEAQAKVGDDVPLWINEKGVPAVVPGVTEHRRMQADLQRAQREEAQAERQRVQDELNARRSMITSLTSMKAPDLAASPEEHAAYRDSRAILAAEQSEYRKLIAENYGSKPSPQTADRPKQTYQSGDQADAAFKAGRILPGEPFIINGVEVAFDENGDPHPVR